MSEELTILESCLKEAETGNDSQEDVCMSDTAQTNTEMAIQSLTETLRARDFNAAIVQVKVFRYGQSQRCTAQTLKRGFTKV